MTPWDRRVAIKDAAKLAATLRSAGLPLGRGILDEGGNQDKDGASASSIVCVAQILNNKAVAIVISPSGIAYQFESENFSKDRSFWQFAARHYYWVVGTLADKRRLSAMTNVLNINGRALSSVASFSGLSITGILAELGYYLRPAQLDLFEGVTHVS